VQNPIKVHHFRSIRDKKSRGFNLGFLMLALIALFQYLARFMQYKHCRGKCAGKAYKAVVVKQYNLSHDKF
jgi:hypothetical protein